MHAPGQNGPMSWNMVLVKKSCFTVVYANLNNVSLLLNSSPGWIAGRVPPLNWNLAFTAYLWLILFIYLSISLSWVGGPCNNLCVAFLLTHSWFWDKWLTSFWATENGAEASNDCTSSEPSNVDKIRPACTKLPSQYIELARVIDNIHREQVVSIPLANTQLRSLLWKHLCCSHA